VALSREVQMGRVQVSALAGQPAPQSLFGFPISDVAAEDAASAPIAKSVPKTAHRVLPMCRQERYAT